MRDRQETPLRCVCGLKYSIGSLRASRPRALAAFHFCPSRVWQQKNMSALPPSVYDLMREVVCNPPSRTRSDDQIVELFLNAHQGGRFAHRVEWLPQSRTSVEVVATNAAGTRLAVEHTRLFAFEEHKRQEELLRPIATCLEAEARLHGLNRRFDLLFRPDFLGKLPQRSRTLVKDGLISWAVMNLPALGVGTCQELEVPICLPKGKTWKIHLRVGVSRHIPPARPVCVSGCLPEDPKRLLPIIHKALAGKLKKLVDAKADQRILLLELPTLDSERKVICQIRDMADRFPLLHRIDQIVIAKTFGYQSDNVVYCYAWDVAAEKWSEFLKVVAKR